MSEITYKTPENNKEFREYDLFRWEILRKPLGKDIDSLKDKYEESAFHLVGIKDQKIIACGRLHFNKTYEAQIRYMACLLYTSPSPRDRTRSRMPSSA